VEFANFLEKNQGLQLQIQAATLKIKLRRTMCNFFIKKEKEKEKSMILWAKQTFFWIPCPSAFEQFKPNMAASKSSSKITRKMNLIQEK
jgi:hypothetical protein